MKKSNSRRDKILAFDPSGEGLTQWRRQFAALEIGHLRSPAVHHRDPNPYELRRFAENRSSELFPPEDLPGSRLFEEFCGDTIKRWQLGDRVIKAKVTRIQPKSGRFRLWFEDGKSARVRSYPEGNRPPSNRRRRQWKTAFTSVGKSNSNTASRRKNSPLPSSRFAKFAIARRTNINCRWRTNQRTFSSRSNCQRSQSPVNDEALFPRKTI